MTIDFNFVLSDEQETINFGAALASLCEQSTTIFLHGNLGAGKTTFSRGFIQSLGHKGKVKSPTYTLVEPYQLESRNVYHFDLYRLADPEELEFMGIRDYFTPNSICLIEWPERGIGILPNPDLEITLHYDGEQRIAQLHSNTHVGDKLITNLEWKN